MKKLCAILLAVAMMASLATFASAAENTMVLKTTVPGASYTLSIPATMEVPFGAEEVEFERPQVIESAGFQGRDLRFYVSDIGAIGDDTYRLPMQVVANVDVPGGTADYDIAEGQGMYFIFADEETGEIDDIDCYMVGDDNDMLWVGTLSLLFEKADWYKLSPGEHTGYIEFTSEIVPNVWEN